MHVGGANSTDYVQSNQVKPTTVKSFPFSTSLFFRKSKEKFLKDLKSVEKNDTTENETRINNSKENTPMETSKNSFFTVIFFL